MNNENEFSLILQNKKIFAHHLHEFFFKIRNKKIPKIDSTTNMSCENKFKKFFVNKKIWDFKMT